MDLILNIFTEIIAVFNESAIYILFGFLIAALLHFLMTPDFVTKFLGGKNSKSVIRASLLGIPLPLCSCSVVPAAISMRKQGASKGSTLSFLISTPETGVDSISLTYALMDPIMTFFRPLSALITAICAGLLANAIDRKDDDSPLPKTLVQSCQSSKTDCCTTPPAETGKKRGLWEKAKALYQYAYVDLLQDIVAWLLISIVLAGIVAALIPDSFFEEVLGNGFLSMLVMLVVGIPLYQCASSSTPLAAALILKGLNPGAALVFLLAGPATNIGTVMLVGKILGKKMMVVYLATISCVSLALGGLLNLIYFGLAINPLVTMGSASELIPEPIKIFGSILLIILILLPWCGLSTQETRLRMETLVRDTFGVSWTFREQSFQKLCRIVGLSKKCLPVLVILGYLFSGVYVVQPGQQAMVQRFGKVIQKEIPPGLYYHWPYPVEQVILNPVDWVRRVKIGYRLSEGWEFAEKFSVVNIESENLTGDENIVNLSFTVQYIVNDLFAYQYSVDNQDLLIRNLAESIMREVVSSKEIEWVLTKGRGSLEAEVQQRLQQLLDGYQAGAGITRVLIRRDHAPDKVHRYFRDVASSVEDRSKRINQAWGNRNQTLAQARGKAAQTIEDAKAYRIEKINRALGEGERFTLRLNSAEKAPEITRTRLYLETMEKSLAPVKKFIKPPKGSTKSLELWYQTSQTSSTQTSQSEEHKADKSTTGNSGFPWTQ